MSKVYRTEERTQEMIDEYMIFEEEYSDNEKDDWTYEMLLCKNGLALIEVYDEDGTFVGYL